MPLARPPFPARVAVMAWAVLLVAVAVRVGVSPPRSQSVVPIYRLAAERWHAGETPYANAPGLDMYRNPPGFAVAYYPFAALPEKASAVLWRLAGAGLFVWGFLGCCRHAVGFPPDQTAWAAAAACPLALSSVNNGQLNLHLTGVMLLAAAAAARGRATAVALWVAAGAGMKLYPVAAGLLVCVALPRAGWRLVPALIAVFGFPYLFADAEFVNSRYREFTDLLVADDRTHCYDINRAPRDWTIVPRVWAGVCFPRDADEIVAAAAGLAFAGATVLARRGGRPHAAGVAAGLGLVWMTLFGPATETPTYTLLAPVAAAALAAGRGWGRAAAAAAALLLMAPILRAMFPSGEVWPCRTTQPTAAAILMLLLLRAAVTGRAASGASASAPGSPSPAPG